MSRPKKKKGKRKKGKQVAVQDLPVHGKKQLEGGLFSEAIKTFRQLLQQGGDTDQWLPVLSLAYKGRINQLLEKGMAKEALVIYGNMVHICAVEDQLLNFNLLLLSSKYKEAFELYLGFQHSLDEQQVKEFEELIAALLLIDANKILPFLEEDSLAKIHYPYAERVLAGYCSGDNESAIASLRNISFRSPYKNFRLALRGMLAFATDRKEALGCFEKIPTSSHFFHWTVPFRQICGRDDGAIKPSRIERQIAQRLTGVDVGTNVFVDGIRSRQHDPDALYGFLVNKKGYLSREKLKDLCLRLVPHALDKFLDYQRRYGIPNELDFSRLVALGCEVEHDLWGAVEAWEDVIEILEEKAAPEDGLKIALLYRYCVALLGREDEGYNIDQINAFLEKSLEHDPVDLESYTTLINNHRGRQKEKYTLINRALEIFPDNTEVLFIATEAAIERGAFKKASRLASSLLAIDPINTKARLMLIDAHLEHGRKLAVQGKYALAYKECDAAAGYDRANLGRGRVEIAKGLIFIHADDPETGMLLYGQGAKRMGNPLLACFQAGLEVALLEMQPKWRRHFDKEFRAVAKAVPDPAALMVCAEVFHRCKGKSLVHLQRIRTIIAPWLKKGSKLDFSREEYVFLCSVFDHAHYYALLELYGRHAEQLWPDQALFIFYRLFGRSQGGEKALTLAQLDQLREGLYLAEEQRDFQTAKRIEHFLYKEQYHARHDADFAETEFDESLDEAGGDIFKIPPQLSGGERQDEEKSQTGKDKPPEKTMKQLNLFE